MKIKVLSKIIGNWYPEKNLFTKKVRKSKHLFRTTDSWGIDHHFFTSTLLPPNAFVEITDTEENRTHKTTAEQIRREGKILNFKPYGVQIFLTRDKWIVPEAPKMELKLKQLTI